MIHQRLQELRTELTKGEQQLARLEGERANVRDTVLRIQGAIQVLEELASAENVEARPVLAHTS